MSSCPLSQRQQGSRPRLDPVSEVMGNFKKYSREGKEEVNLLDGADGKAV